VVTSTWRKYPEWKDCLQRGGLRASVPILGTTSLPTRDRAQEIADYLTAHPDISSFLIFDDQPALAEAPSALAERLVLCDPGRGFGEEEYNKAVALHQASAHTSQPPA
jgi:hypothetical protein